MPVVRNGTLRSLRNLTEGLIYVSESDGPVTAVFLSSEDVGGASAPEEALARVTGAAPGSIVGQGVAEFLSGMTTPQAWWGEAERGVAARFSALADALGKLTDVRAFRVGDGPDIEVYLIGGDPKNPGSFAGVRTRVTET
jgi:hypothetical protein